MTGRAVLATLVAGAGVVTLEADPQPAHAAHLRPARSADPQPAHGTYSEPAPEAQSGSLQGTVRLSAEEIPTSTSVENTTDPEICGQIQSRQDLVVSAGNRGLANVIVSLTGTFGPEADRPAPPEATGRLAPGASESPAQTRLVLENTDCRFVPHVAVVTVGSTIETISNDPVLHTVHFYGALEENVALPDRGASATVRVDSPGMITVLCDVHGWMSAHIRVDPHPYHAVTDEHGSFLIPDVPAGTYDLEVWHERLGTQTIPVTVESDSTSQTEIVFPSRPEPTPQVHNQEPRE